MGQTALPFTNTLSSALPVEMSRPKEPARPTLYHSHFQLLVTLFLKGELLPNHPSAHSKQPPLLELSLLNRMKTSSASLLAFPRRVYLKSCHSIFNSKATIKYSCPITVMIILQLSSFTIKRNVVKAAKPRILRHGIKSLKVHKQDRRNKNSSL